MRTMPNIWQYKVASGNAIRFLLDPDPIPSIHISFIVSLCTVATRVVSVLINHKRVGRSRLFDPHLIMSWCLARTVIKSNKRSCNSESHFIRCKNLSRCINQKMLLILKNYFNNIALILKNHEYKSLMTERSLHVKYILLHSGISIIQLHVSLSFKLLLLKTDKLLYRDIVSFWTNYYYFICELFFFFSS